MRQTYRKIQPWVIWGLGAAFFFSEYFARVAPSVMTHQLMATFHVTALTLGGLSAFFYYPYVLMQIPVGMLVDRYGPRRLLTLAALLTAIACTIFATSHHLRLTEIARAFMGFGASFAFVGALKLATIWFEPRRLGLLAGLTQGMGMLGAAVGVGVFGLVVTSLGWRSTILIIASILFVLAIFIGLLVRDRRATLLSHRVAASVAQVNIFEGLLIVFRNRHSWINALYAGLIYAPTGAFAELWGPSYLHRTYGFSDNLSALAVGTIFLGWAVGGPLVGWMTDKMQRRKPLMFLSGLFSLILISIVLYIPHIALPLLFVLFFLYGVSNTGVAIAYAVAGELNPQSVSGISIAFTNMVSILIAGWLLQPAIGWLLDLRWTGIWIHGAPFYSAQDFREAMFILPFCLVIACGLVFFIKETYCQRK